MAKLSEYKIYKDGTIKNKFGFEIANTRNNKGYIYATIDGKQIPKHRLIWEAFNGEIPDGMEIDHINGNPSDNRLENLRLVTHEDNCNNPVTKERYKNSNKGKSNNSYYQKMIQKMLGWWLTQLSIRRKIREKKYED